MIHWFIYKITNPEGEVYVGKTQDAHVRKRQHFLYTISNNKIKDNPLKQSLKKYGADNHTFKVVDNFFSTDDYSVGKEIFWIRSYMSNRVKWPKQNGLNLTDGGYGISGHRHTEEVRGRMAASGAVKIFTEKHRANLSTSLVKRHSNGDGSKLPNKRGSGTNNGGGKKRLPVLKFDLDGKFIEEFPSISAANRSMGWTKGAGIIGRVCRGEANHTNGFIFRFK